MISVLKDNLDFTVSASQLVLVIVPLTISTYLSLTV